MASTDARPVPIKNTAYRVTFPILDADGDLVTGAAGLDSEVSKDAGTFTDCTNEATEIATASGMYFLDLTSTEMNADCVAIIVKTSTSGAKTVPIVLYPQETGDIKVDVQSLLGTAWLTPATAGTPDVNVKQWNGLTTVALPLVPTTAGRTLDVTATGEAGIDWANIGAPTTTVALTGTTISTSQVSASITGSVGSVTGAVGSVTGNVGGNVVGSVGSVTGNVGGSVGSVTARVTANTDQFNGDATAAANIAKTTRAIGRGTVTTGSSTTSILTSAFVPNGAAANQFVGRIITFDATTATAALQGQSTDITASSNAANPTFTVTALTTAPANGDTFSVT